MATMSTDEYKKLTQALFALHDVGSEDDAFESVVAAVSFHGAAPDLIRTKWTEYIDLCTIENRQSRYIKTLSTFLNDQMWKQNFKSKTKDAGANWHLKMQELLKDQNMDI